jgi:hypothetical protein
MRQKLILVGCSWACGEWLVDDNQVLNINHPGLSEYLASDYDVINLSRSGASNWQLCFSLRNYLTHVKTFDQFKIVVIQTDAARNQCSEKYHVDYAQVLQDSINLKNFYERNLEIFYIKLNSLAQEFNTPIYLVGGLNDLASNILPLYNNLVPMCESWTGLMHASYRPTVVPLLLGSFLYSVTKKHNKLDLMDEISQYSDINFLQAQELMETDWFGPSLGDFHPSRKAHKLLANYIREFFAKESP